MVSDVGVGAQAGVGAILITWNGCARILWVPHVIHFCQRYGLGDYLLASDGAQGLYRAGAPLLAEPPLEYSWK
jgi:hypothetical protein